MLSAILRLLRVLTKLNLLELLSSQNLLSLSPDEIKTLVQDLEELRVSEADGDAAMGVQVFASRDIAHLND